MKSASAAKTSGWRHHGVPLVNGTRRKTLLSLSLAISMLAIASPGSAETLFHLFEKAHITPLKKPKAAYSFTLSDVNGTQLRLRDLRGKIVFLNIWATWCAPCRQEMPSIERLHQHFKGQDFTVLAVSVDMAETEVVRAFVEKHAYTFTVLHDPQGDIMDWFRVRLIPVTYLIDRSGKIVGKAVGVRDWTDEDTIRVIDVLVRGSD